MHNGCTLTLMSKVATQVEHERPLEKLKDPLSPMQSELGLLLIEIYIPPLSQMLPIHTTLWQLIPIQTLSLLQIFQS